MSTFPSTPSTRVIGPASKIIVEVDTDAHPMMLVNFSETKMVVWDKHGGLKSFSGFFLADVVSILEE